MCCAIAARETENLRELLKKSPEAESFWKSYKIKGLSAVYATDTADEIVEKLKIYSIYYKFILVISKNGTIRSNRKIWHRFREKKYGTVEKGIHVWTQKTDSSGFSKNNGKFCIPVYVKWIF